MQLFALIIPERKVSIAYKRLQYNFKNYGDKWEALCDRYDERIEEAYVIVLLYISNSIALIVDR